MVEVLTDELYGGESKKERGGYKFIQWAVDGGIARLTLNRPPHNILNAEMLTEIGMAIETLHDHPDVKVIYMHAGKDAKSFCGGVDLPEYTVQMFRPDPFNQLDGCGDGSVEVLANGRVDKHYNLWSRNPREVTAKEIDMALRLVDDMSEDWAPEKYKDTYRHDLLARIREKIKKGQTEEITEPEEGEKEAAGAEVIDLMALLRKSVERKQEKPKRSHRAKRRAA